MDVIFIYKDLYSSKKLDCAEKYVLTQIRYGTEKFGQFTPSCTKLAEYCDNAYDAGQIKFCIDKLVGVGVLEKNEVEVSLDGKEPYKATALKINEKLLKNLI